MILMSQQKNHQSQSIKVLHIHHIVVLNEIFRHLDRAIARATEREVVVDRLVPRTMKTIQMEYAL